MISLSGLDLSGIRWETPDLPARERGPDRRSDFRVTVMRDIKPFVAHAAREPEEITSRSQLREYERRHGVIQVGTDIRAEAIIAENKARVERWEELSKGVPSGWTD